VLADQLLTRVPQRSGPNWIASIGANSLAHLINIAHEQILRHVAVLSVLPTDLVGRGDKSRPNRGCRALPDALQLKRRLPRRCQLNVHLRHPRRQRGGIHMPPSSVLIPPG
jgi:hypothetical protein